MWEYEYEGSHAILVQYNYPMSSYFLFCSIFSKGKVVCHIGGEMRCASEQKDSKVAKIAPKI